MGKGEEKKSYISFAERGHLSTKGEGGSQKKRRTHLGNTTRGRWPQSGYSKKKKQEKEEYYFPKRRVKKHVGKEGPQ